MSSSNSIKTTITFPDGKQRDAFYVALLFECNAHGIRVKWVDYAPTLLRNHAYRKQLAVLKGDLSDMDQRKYNQIINLQAAQICLTVKADSGMCTGPVYVTATPDKYLVTWFVRRDDLVGQDQ